MQQEQFYNQASATSDWAELPPEMPQCCGTGCTVCVLDYPELFSDAPACNQIDAEALALLEAIEQAEAAASRLIADASGQLR